MSFDKSIQSGKEHRKPYRGAKSIDSTCRNHGSCEWCHGNRTHKNDKRELAAEKVTGLPFQPESDIADKILKRIIGEE